MGQGECFINLTRRVVEKKFGGVGKDQNTQGIVDHGKNFDFILSAMENHLFEVGDQGGNTI